MPATKSVHSDHLDPQNLFVGILGILSMGFSANTGQWEFWEY